MNRRQFFKATAGAAALLAFKKRAYAFYNSPALAKFIQPLRTFANGGLVLASADPTPGVAGATHYTLRLNQFQDQLHPALGPTTLWGYNQGTDASKKHLSGTIVCQMNQAVQVTFVNELPSTHIMPVDASSFMYDAQSLQNKAATHLHGGFIPWVHDGGPYDWFTPQATGPSFKNNQFLNPGGNAPWYGRPAGSAEYYWPNQQSARLMWYHDHAHDMTRINAYAGIASAYVLRDGFENNLIAKGLLPSLATAAEIPLIFQDKTFVGEDIGTRDPTWPGPTAPGSLWYPHVYEAPDRWDTGIGPFAASNFAFPEPTCVPEAFQDTMLVNGTCYPYLEVEPRRYRFRVLNACNARFVNLQLYVRDNSADGLTLGQIGTEIDINGNPVVAPTNPAGPAMVQIGTEGGFLPAPVILNSPPRPIGYLMSVAPTNPTYGNVNRYNLVLAPAERADVVIDFSAFAGKTLILYSDAPAPFPGGDVRNDLYYGMPSVTPPAAPAPTVVPGSGPNNRTIMEIRVKTSGPRDAVSFSTWLSLIRAQLASRIAELIAPPLAGAVRRPLTLNETFDQWGRLIQMIGTNVALYNQPAPPAGTGLPFFGRYLEDPATEVVSAGATEIWEIYNLTGDTHPIHFHLINLQILNRQAFDTNQFPNVVFLGPARLPDLNERGWKETVRINPGEVIRVIMKFDLPKLPFPLPTSDRATLGLPTPPPGKIYHEYVYHCHILEHEEHDMMRPLVVIGPSHP